MPTSERVTRKDIEIAINRLKLMKFFPADPGAHATLGELLARMCPSADALNWLTKTLVDRVPEWPGAHAVRGLLCTKFDPADGIDAWCEIPGFRAEDNEGRAIEQSKAFKSGSWQIEDEAFAKLARSLDMKQITERKQ